MTGPRPTTLVVTNDFPPRIGGIESFVAQACRMLDDRVVVLTSRSPGWQECDRTLPYRVVRLATPVLLPTPAVGRAAEHLLSESGATRVLFGASAPLGLLGPRLRAAGAQRIVALSHGHEVWWARVPGTRQALRRIGAGVDVLGHISDFTAREITPALRAEDRAKLVRVAPPVDLELFSPGSRHVAPLRLDRRGEDDGPLLLDQREVRIVAAGRFVACKGWRTLLAAWHEVLDGLASQPDPPSVVLELIGRGPWRRRLERAAARFPAGTVRIRDAVPHHRMPEVLAGARAFALPVRSRWPGLEPEGLGMVFVEAAACGIAVLAGRSGGTPETVVQERSGWCLDPDDVAGWVDRLRAVIDDPGLATALGQVGRVQVAPRFSQRATRLALHAALQIPLEQ